MRICWNKSCISYFTCATKRCSREHTPIFSSNIRHPSGRTHFRAYLPVSWRGLVARSGGGCAHAVLMNIPPTRISAIGMRYHVCLHVETTSSPVKLARILSQDVALIRRNENERGPYAREKRRQCVYVRRGEQLRGAVRDCVLVTHE